MEDTIENTINYTFTDLNQLVSNLCSDMEQDNWVPDVVVGISRGGTLPGIMISYYFDKPFILLNCDTDIDLNVSTLQTLSQNDNILIVDDICNTGVTLDTIISEWESTLPLDEELDLGGNIRLATLNFVRSCEFEVDYIGEFISTERVVYPVQAWWQ